MGNSSVNPAAPKSCIARSATKVNTAGATTLIAEISVRAALVPYVVDHPCRLQDQEASLLDTDPGLGDPLLDDALLREGPAEGGPALRTLHHQVEASLRGADRPHAVMDPSRSKTGLGNGKTATRLAEKVRRRHPRPIEVDLGVSTPVLIAEDSRFPLDLDTRGVEGNDHHRLPPMGIGIGIGDPHHDRDLASRRGGAGAEPFPTADHQAVAIALDSGPDVGGVGAGHVGLCHREAGSDLAIEQGLKPHLLLLRSSEHVEDLHVPGVGGRAIECLGRDLRAATSDLGKRCVVQIGQAGPKVWIGEEQVPQALLAAPRPSTPRSPPDGDAGRRPSLICSR